MNYCEAGVTPGWDKAVVIDRQTGEIIQDVTRCNSEEGWLYRYVSGPDGKPVVEADGDLKQERLTGDFEIRENFE